jgi:hypothetical protein
MEVLDQKIEASEAGLDRAISEQINPDISL